MYKYLFESLLLILLCIYPEVELLDHMVILFLIFWGITKRFSLAAVLFYIPTPSAQGFQFLYIFANICYFLFLFLSFFLTVVILMCVKWYLLVVSICISLIISGTLSIISCASWSLVISSLEKCLFKFFGHFLIVFLVFLVVSCKNSLYILDINSYNQIYDLQIFFPILWVALFCC